MHEILINVAFSNI